MAFSLGQRLGTPSGPGILLPLWLLAAYVFVASPFFVFFQIAESSRTLNVAATAELESELAPAIEQNRISRVLRFRLGNLLEEQSLPFNYITLRNADRVVLISRGRIGGVTDENAGATRRRFRSQAYRALSSDRKTELNVGQSIVGYAEYGLSWRGIFLHALSRALWPLSLGLLAFGLLFYLSPRLIIALADRMKDDRRRPVRRAGRAVARKIGTPIKVAMDERMTSHGLGALGDQLRIGMVIIGSDGKITDGNVSAAHCLATEVRKLPGMDAIEALTLFDKQGRGMESPLSRCLANPGERIQARGWLRRRDRPPLGVEIHGVSGRLPVPGACIALIFDRDSNLSTMLAMEERAGLAENLMRVSDEPIAVVDARGRVAMANAVWARTFGYSGEALKGMPLAKLLGAPFEPRDLAQRENVPGAGLHRSGKQFELKVSLVDCDWDSKKGHVLRVTVDAREKADVDAPFEDDLPKVRFASRDTVTGLANRPVMMRELRRELADPAAVRPLLLMMVDIRDFRRVNMRRGREAGDAALAAVAALLEDAVPNALSLVRLGGDEFALLVPQPDEERPEAYLARVTDAIRGRLDKALYIEGSDLSLTVDVGASLLPQNANTPEDLLQQAETALYAAKQADNGKPALYSTGSHDGVAGDSNDGTLAAAFAADQIRLLMQPIEAASFPGKISAVLVGPEWTACPDGPLGGAEIWAQAAQADIDAELGGRCVQQIVKSAADWDSLELEQVTIIMQLPSAVATSRAFRRAWDLARTRYNVSPDITLLWFARGDLPDPDLVPSGFGLAEDCDVAFGPAEAAEVHCVSAELFAGTGGEERDEQIEILLKRARESHARLLVGPVEDKALRGALAAAQDNIYIYGDLSGGAQSARAFGRRLARQGAVVM